MASRGEVEVAVKERAPKPLLFGAAASGDAMRDELPAKRLQRADGHQDRPQHAWPQRHLDADDG